MKRDGMVESRAMAFRQQVSERLRAADWLHRVKGDLAIAVIRTQTLDLSLQLARVAIAAGLSQIEITSTSAEFARAIATLRSEYPEVIVGAGTVVDLEVAREALTAGAQFLFAPYYTAAVMGLARDLDIAMVPGALTPTEIGVAWREGATAVKVFPIQSVGGARYLKALRGPMGQIPLIPTGGVTCENSRSFLAAGAVAVGLSTDLFPPALVRDRDWLVLDRRIRNWLETIRLLSSHAPTGNTDI